MTHIHLELAEANELVSKYHRHNKPVTGHRFSIGALDEKGVLIGAAIIGRPVARALDYRTTVEILRVATNGKKNANSFLYGQAIRAIKALGHSAAITYTLEKESQSTMKALGAKCEGLIVPHEWDCPSRRRKSQPVYKEPRYRWKLL
jgi:hypothetical protein